MQRLLLFGKTGGGANGPLRLNVHHNMKGNGAAKIPRICGLISCGPAAIGELTSRFIVVIVLATQLHLTKNWNGMSKTCELSTSAIPYLP